MYSEEIERIIKNDYRAYELTKYFNDNVFLEEFIDFTRPYLADAAANSEPSLFTVKAVFTAFAFVAMKSYDGSLWGHIKRYYSSANSTDIDYDKIRVNVFNKWAQSYYCQGQQIQVPVVEAVLPYNYAVGFIDFVFDIYSKNLDFSLENVDDELDLLFKSLQMQMSENEDSENEDGFADNQSNDQPKLYDLRRGTKKIIIHNIKGKLRQLKLFVKEYLLRLEASYQNTRNFIPNYYFDTSFAKWKEKHPEVTNGKHNSGARNFYLKSKAPVFVLNTSSGRLELHTPRLRVPKTRDVSKIRCEVFDDQMNIYSSVIPSYNINRNLVSIMEIPSVTVNVSDPFHNIKCIITNGDEILYDSDERLYRGVLFFNDGKEVFSNTIQNGSLYVIYSGSHDKIENLKTFKDYSLGKFEVSEDTSSIAIGQKVYSFSGSLRSEVFGTLCNYITVFRSVNEEREIIPVYSNVSLVTLISKNTIIKGNYIKINDESIDSQFFEVKEQVKNIAYTLNDSSLFERRGYYHIKLLDRSKKDEVIVDEFQFIIDDMINVDEGMVSDNKISITYSGSFEISDDHLYTKTFDIDMNDASNQEFKYFCEGKTFYCTFPIMIPYFQYLGLNHLFDCEFNGKTLDLTNNLYFFNLTKNVLLVTQKIRRKISINKDKLGQYIRLAELIDYKEKDIVRLLFRDTNGSDHAIVIYNKPIYDKKESQIFLDSVKQQISIYPVVKGPSDDINLDIYLDNQLYKQNERIDLSKAPFVYGLDQNSHDIKIDINTTKENDWFDEEDEKETLFEFSGRYIPLVSLLNKRLLIKCAICKDGFPEKFSPQLFMKLTKEIHPGLFECDVFQDSICSNPINTKLLSIEFDPIYLSEISSHQRNMASKFAKFKGSSGFSFSRKHRINGVVQVLDEQEQPIYFKEGTLLLESQPKTKKIDYLVIEEESTPW